jgi:hypothetical protein
MKPIAFEISLDDNFFRPNRKNGEVESGADASISSPVTTSSRKALPKLDLTHNELQNKLANTEARWKVGDW